MSDVLASATAPLTKPIAVAPVVPPETPAATQVPAVELQPSGVPETTTALEASVPETNTQGDTTELLQPFVEELSTKGSLSKESLQNLATKLDAPLEVVELVHDGMLARQATRNNDILTVAGGLETYNEMVKWASGVYTEDESKEFNAALVSGTKDSAITAVNKLRQRFTAVNGSPKVEVAAAQRSPAAPVVAPKAPAVASVQPFASFQEQCAAQNDKRYGKDSAYTAEVYKRIALSVSKKS
jgi:hypothetical protein